MLAASNDFEVMVQDVSFDSFTGLYAASLRIRNNGTEVARQVAIVLPGLPGGVNVTNASGSDAQGTPYLNLAGGLPRGGLQPGQLSKPVELKISDPTQLNFSLLAGVLVSQNQSPLLDPVAPLSLMPGEYLEVVLSASDPDGDMLMFTMESDIAELPNGGLSSAGKLVLAPLPGQEGSYQLSVAVSDGAAKATQNIQVDVLADPVSTTRISGVLKNTDVEPLPDIVVEIGNVQTTTAADGSFQFEFAADPPSDTLKIHDAIIGNDAYPFIAEKLVLLLEREVFVGSKNQFPRPIYLPAIDMANAQTIDPDSDTLVTTAAIPGASVFVAQGTLKNQQGQPFDGQLSITEVPRDLTPAALPDGLLPDTVVTIQPAEMQFTTPAPLTLPNRSGFPPGTSMTLWSINPETGLFDEVGTGQVSSDGSVVETVSGGIRNSSWHLFTDGPPDGGSNDNGRGCSSCKVTGKGNSEYELKSGAVIETHELSRLPIAWRNERRNATL